MDYLLLIWCVSSCIVGCKDDNAKSKIQVPFPACPEVFQCKLCIIQVKQFPLIILQYVISPMMLITPGNKTELRIVCLRLPVLIPMETIDTCAASSGGMGRNEFKLGEGKG